MPDPFNLERTIEDWKRQLAAGGIKGPQILNELESHLREDIERQTREGVEAQTAFQVAVKRIGTSKVLRREFEKINGWRKLAHKLMLVIALGLLIIFSFFGSAAAYLCYATWSERVLAFGGLAATVFVAYLWKRATPFLPVMANHRKRTLIEWGSLVAGIAVSTFFCQVILPHFDRTLDGQLPAVGAWTMLPVMIGLAFMLGLEEAAKRDISTRSLGSPGEPFQERYV